MSDADERWQRVVRVVVRRHNRQVHAGLQQRSGRELVLESSLVRFSEKCATSDGKKARIRDRNKQQHSAGAHEGEWSERARERRNPE